jgi:hypothetical protein
MLRSLLAAAVLATAAAPSVAHAAAPRPADSIDALYVVNAASGSYDGRTLTLHGVAPSVAWFADRPARTSGVEPMRTVTTQLFGGKQAKPNAALDLADDGELAGIAALTLSGPHYNTRTRTLTYRTTRLPSLTSTKLSHLEAQRSTAKLPRTFHAAALFIDDGDVSTADGVTSAPPGANEPWIAAEQFQTEVLAASFQRPVLVDFCLVSLATCGPMGMGSLDAAYAKYKATMSFFRLDLGAAAALMQQYSVKVAPTLMVFEAGQVVARYDGSPTVDQIFAFLATVPSMEGEEDQLRSPIPSMGS